MHRLHCEDRIYYHSRTRHRFVLAKSQEEADAHPALVAEDIRSVEDLSLLSEEDLHGLGIRLGPRKRILRAVSGSKTRVAPQLGGVATPSESTPASSSQQQVSMFAYASSPVEAAAVQAAKAASQAATLTGELSELPLLRGDIRGPQ